jgi:hypothetical protein
MIICGFFNKNLKFLTLFVDKKILTNQSYFYPIKIH